VRLPADAKRRARTARRLHDNISAQDASRHEFPEERTAVSAVVVVSEDDGHYARLSLLPIRRLDQNVAH
jgi:hypothetical protein